MIWRMIAALTVWVLLSIPSGVVVGKWLRRVGGGR